MDEIYNKLIDLSHHKIDKNKTPDYYANMLYDLYRLMNIQESNILS